MGVDCRCHQSTIEDALNYQVFVLSARGANRLAILAAPLVRVDIARAICDKVVRG